VTTVTDQTVKASADARPASRAALLAALTDASNWHKPADCRPALRAAICSRITSHGLKMWALWLADRFGADGQLHRADRRSLTRWSQISDSTCTRYLAELDRLGLIERHQTARLNRRTGHYDRAVTIRVASELVEPADQPVRIPQAADLPNGHKRASAYIGCSSSSGSVGTFTTGSRPDDQELGDADRRAVDDWPRLARSRTDVPLLRPGYSVNTSDPAERRRLLLDRPPPEPEPLAPHVAAIIAEHGTIEGFY